MRSNGPGSTATGADAAAAAFDDMSSELAVLRRTVDALGKTVEENTRAQPEDYGATLDETNARLARLETLVDRGTHPSTIAGRVLEASTKVRDQLEAGTAARERAAAALERQAKGERERAAAELEHARAMRAKAERTIDRGRWYAVLAVVTGMALAAGILAAAIALNPVRTLGWLSGTARETMIDVLWCQNAAETEQAASVRCQVDFYRQGPGE